ncbi:MAG: RNA polymerase sigma factor [Tissierellia bacterium]|nr:RNA polymerase sigma factor [Tissierellia bacterium]
MLPFLLIVEDFETRSKLEQIYHNYKKIAYWTAFDILKDHHEAEDVVQDAIIRMSKSIDKIEDTNCNKTKALFVIIVRNLSFNVYNRRKKIVYTDYLETETISEDISVDEEMVRLEETEWIADILGKLNPDYADVLVLKYYYGYSNTEISSLLDITEGNVRVRLHRARLAIKELIEKEEFNNASQL